MGSYKYAYMNLGEDQCDLDAMDALADVFAILIDQLSLDPDLSVSMFLSSGLAHLVETRSTAVVRGMTGAEQAAWLLERCGYGALEEVDVVSAFSNPSWFGRNVAFCQSKSGISFARIFDSVSYEEITSLRFGREDWDEEQIYGLITQALHESQPASRLAQKRKSRHMTQMQLASSAGISVRTLQQYEQGSKNFDHAALSTVCSIARVLGCRAEDLLSLGAI